MEKFKTYVFTLTGEYTSWNNDYKEWVTHGAPVCFPLTHERDGYIKLMKEAFPGVFYITDGIELIEIEVKKCNF